MRSLPVARSFPSEVMPCSFCSMETTGISFSRSARKVLAEPVKEEREKLP